MTRPEDGRIVVLKPRAARTPPASRRLLSGLTSQGLAFARLRGRWVLYVGESDQIDRYP